MITHEDPAPVRQLRREQMLPLYEGKMGHQFNHRFASFMGTGDSDLKSVDQRSAGLVVVPRYWVDPPEFDARTRRRKWGSRSALLGHRRVARNNDERTAICCLLPFGPASYGWIVSAGPDTKELISLSAIYNSFVFDYALRNSLSQPSVPQGTSQQIPVPTPEMILTPPPWDNRATLSVILCRHVLELTYTAWDMAPFAADLGDLGPPFVWDPERRFLLRTELDAMSFHLYGVVRDDVDYIMDTFSIVRRKDEAAHGEYRTKRVILEMFDAIQSAVDTGAAYETLIDPPPGEGSRHAPKTE